MPQIKNEVRMFCPFCENVIIINAINIVVNGKKYFSIAERLEDDLNKGIISERLKNEFKNKGISLSKDAIIIKDREDKWTITDKKIHIAKKEDDKLNVYDVNITAICPILECDEEIHLRRAKAKCPCGHDNYVYIPEGTQILETHYIDISCKKCDRKERKNKRENGCLFRVSSNFKTDLENKVISEDLKKRFKDEKHQLSRCAKTSPVNKNKWEIKDCKKVYKIRKSKVDDKLDIYGKDKIYWTKCEERPNEAAYLLFREIETKCDKCEGKFHIRIIKGEKSTCLLTGGEECSGINQSILGGMTNRFGNFCQKLYLYFQKEFFCGCTSISPSLIKRFGELAFCIIIGMSLAALYPHIIFLIFGHLDPISWQYRAFWGCLFSGGLYFSFLILKETVIVCGELELKLREDIKEDMFIPFFIFRRLFFGLFFVIFMGLAIADELMLYGLNIPIVEVAKIRWLDNLSIIGLGVLFSLIIQVFAGFGILIYVIWADSQTRHGSSFKTGFLEIAPSIEKLSEIAIHTVLFLASAVFLNGIIWNHFERNTALGQIYFEQVPEINFLYGAIIIGLIIIMPLVLYFLYLGKLTNNLKAIELAKIDDKIKRLSTHRSEKKREDITREKETLLSCRDRVSKSLRWVVGVEYGSRVLLLIFIGLLMKTIS